MNKESQNWFEVVEQKLGGLRYGQILLTVHEGRVVQIEKTEKTRLEPSTVKATGKEN